MPRDRRSWIPILAAVFAVVAILGLVMVALIEVSGCPGGTGSNATPTAPYDQCPASSAWVQVGWAMFFLGGSFAAGLTIARQGTSRGPPLPYGRARLEPAWRFYPAGGVDLYEQDLDEAREARASERLREE